MRYPLLILLLAFGCSPTDSEDTFISLPTEFPLINQSAFIYERALYDDFSDLLMETNLDTTYLDTLIIFDTSGDYYAWYWTSIDNYYNIVNNVDTKLLHLGYYSFGQIGFYDNPRVIADYSSFPDFNNSDYQYQFDMRDTDVILFNNNQYESYIFSGSDEQTNMNNYNSTYNNYTSMYMTDFGMYKSHGVYAGSGYSSYMTLNLIELIDTIDYNFPRLDECGVWQGNGVDADNDDICDDVDNCVGDFEECPFY